MSKQNSVQKSDVKKQKFTNKGNRETSRNEKKKRIRSSTNNYLLSKEENNKIIIIITIICTFLCNK